MTDRRVLQQGHKTTYKMRGFIPVPIKGTVLAVMVMAVGVCTNSMPVIHPRVARCNHSYHI